MGYGDASARAFTRMRSRVWSDLLLGRLRRHGGLRTVRRWPYLCRRETDASLRRRNSTNAYAYGDASARTFTRMHSRFRSDLLLGRLRRHGGLRTVRRRPY